MDTEPVKYEEDTTQIEEILAKKYRPCNNHLNKVQVNSSSLNVEF